MQTWGREEGVVVEQAQRAWTKTTSRFATMKPSSGSCKDFHVLELEQEKRSRPGRFSAIIIIIRFPFQAKPQGETFLVVVFSHLCTLSYLQISGWESNCSPPHQVKSLWSAFYCWGVIAKPKAGGKLPVLGWKAERQCWLSVWAWGTWKGWGMRSVITFFFSFRNQTCLFFCLRSRISLRVWCMVWNHYYFCAFPWVNI